MRAARAINQRQIGGQVVIDFLRMPFNDREKLNNELRRLFPSAQQASWSKTGVFSFSIPRARASLRDRFTVPLVRGVLGARALTTERQFNDAIWALERALRAAPDKNFVLHLSARLYDYGAARAFVVESLNAQYGGRAEFMRASSADVEMSLEQNNPSSDKGAPCPICNKPRQAAFAPFCSARCADIDLHRWLSGHYAIPAEEQNDDSVREDASLEEQADWGGEGRALLH